MNSSCRAALFCIAALAAGTCAAALPAKVQLVVAGASSPVDIVYANDGTRDLYVVEQGGRIRLLHDGAYSPIPFLDVGPLIATGGERGLLGLAFHPRFTENGRFFVNYTRAGDGATVVAAFRVFANDRTRADPSTRVELLTIAQPYENHNGGAVRFGPDGYLYIGMGDGGSANDPGKRAQNPQELLGKLLRIDVDGAAPYAIPPDNVYASGASGRREIYALGLRNPWRFSFDRVIGDLYIGDVGQGEFEEIDFVPHGTPSGDNFGWRFFEGTHCTMLDPCPPGLLAFTWPVLTYDHGQGCSVTGGFVYRGRDVPVLYGRYIYGDYCSGRIWSAARDRDGVWRTEELFATGHSIATFGEDVDGEIYWSDLATGAIYRIAPDASGPIAIEYFNAALGHYFLTAFPDEAAGLDGGALGGAWKRTGYAFPAWPANGAIAVDVCRFFGKPGIGPNTHFYTGFAAECASLKTNPLWTFEAIGFRMRLPTADECEAPTRPVYRLYNNPATLAAVNHRYTADGATYDAMRAAGWIGEGVAFCAK